MDSGGTRLRTYASTRWLQRAIDPARLAKQAQRGHNRRQIMDLGLLCVLWHPWGSKVHNSVSVSGRIAPFARYEGLRSRCEVSSGSQGHDSSFVVCGPRRGPPGALRCAEQSSAQKGALPRAPATVEMSHAFSGEVLLRHSVDDPPRSWKRSRYRRCSHTSHFFQRS